MQYVSLPHPPIFLGVPPALTPNFLAAAMSFEFGYEMWNAV
jgi:hypothetical protein